MSRTLHSIEYQRLTAWLKNQREKGGHSMRELAEKMGCNHTFVAKVEQRERRLDVVEYLHYCKALDVSPADGLLAMSKNARS